ncbi:MAG: hypothetical protein ACKPEY_18830, partial [Planctomycetota bacterium]
MIDRRQMLGSVGTASTLLGWAALSQLIGDGGGNVGRLLAAEGDSQQKDKSPLNQASPNQASPSLGLPGLPHFAA